MPRLFYGDDTPSPPSPPSPRELEVELLLCHGYSQENIAAILNRSVNTISVHTLHLYRKRKVHTQIELLHAYLKREYNFELPPLPFERKLELVC